MQVRSLNLFVLVIFIYGYAERSFVAVLSKPSTRAALRHAGAFTVVGLYSLFLFMATQSKPSAQATLRHAGVLAMVVGLCSTMVTIIICSLFSPQVHRACHRMLQQQWGG